MYFLSCLYSFFRGEKSDFLLKFGKLLDVDDILFIECSNESLDISFRYGVYGTEVVLVSDARGPRIASWVGGGALLGSGLN